MIYRNNRRKHGSQKGYVNYTVMMPSETGLDVPVRQKIAYTIRAGALPSFDDPGYDDEVDITLPEEMVLGDEDLAALTEFIIGQHEWDVGDD